MILGNRDGWWINLELFWAKITHTTVLNIYKFQHKNEMFPEGLTVTLEPGVPVYLAPWAACPPEGEAASGQLAPRGEDTLGPDLSLHMSQYEIFVDIFNEMS